MVSALPLVALFLLTFCFGSSHALLDIFKSSKETSAEASSTTAAAAAASSSAAATTTASAPASTSTVVSPLGSATDVFVEGRACRASWVPAASGSSTWKDMSIDLMTGSNLEMVKLATVATNLDGTDPNASSYNYTCPSVSPNSAVYFLQYTHDDGLDPTWTTRFAIADTNGNITAPPNDNQPEGGSPAIPWGNGQLALAAPTSTTSLAPTPSQTAQSASTQTPNRSAMAEVYSSIFADSTRDGSSSLQQMAQQDGSLSSFANPSRSLSLPALALAFMLQMM